ncbi:hypothetical protein NU09_0432 [Flavobacterium beibuense]|uniref:Uncharacterized protein n=1 Tax=Flavobacterium beibuense TaxID=657326 RepID=A0A444WJ61_9FLAO|nr:hypothetical protein NU09_0432 [Flavobacterium beibuense]
MSLPQTVIALTQSLGSFWAIAVIPARSNKHEVIIFFIYFLTFFKNGKNR